MICRENYKLRQLETTLKLLLIILVGRRNHLPTFLTFKFPAFSLQALLIWPSLHLNSFFHSATLFSTMFSTYNASKECLSFHLSKNYINMQFKYIFHHLFLLVFLPDSYMIIWHNVTSISKTFQKQMQMSNNPKETRDFLLLCSLI